MVISRKIHMQLHSTRGALQSERQHRFLINLTSLFFYLQAFYLCKYLFVRFLLRHINYQGRIRIGYISAFFLLLVTFLLAMYANRRVVTNAATVEKTNKIISNLEALISAVKDCLLYTSRCV